jgi:hypothetical protein
MKGGRVRVAAVSHSPQFERRANLIRAIESAMEEALDQGRSVVQPAAKAGPTVVARARSAAARVRLGQRRDLPAGRRR